MEEVKRIEQDGYVIRIMQDDDPMSPREWDNLGIILYTSTHYTLGDKCVSGHEIDEIVERDDVIWLPVYAHIHSGIAMNTTGFSDPWDSGQCGIIYVETEKARKEWGKDFSEEKIKTCLRNEIETLNQFVRGDVYGYIVEVDGEHVSSCWGFYGEYGIEDAISQAKLVGEFEVEEAERAACQT
jgi:hypothetical protein